MRKLSFFLAFAFVLTVACGAIAQNGVISIDAVTNDYGDGDQLRAGSTHQISVRYDLTNPGLENPTADWTGSNGYELYSPDGADWVYMSVTTGPLVDGLPGSVVKYQYHYQLVGTTWSRTSNNGVDPCPGAGVIDRAGYYLATVDFTGAGYAEGSSGIALVFEFETLVPDNGLTMCFDSLDAITAWEWAAGSMGDFPVWDNGLGASEPRCWEIFDVPNDPPVWCQTNGDPATPPDYVDQDLDGNHSFNHCGEGTYTLCATDPDDTGEITYEFAPGFETGYGEINGNVWTWSGPTVPQSGNPDIEFRVWDGKDYSLVNFTLHTSSSGFGTARITVW